MDVYLIDGTYELFRHFYAMPSAKDASGREGVHRPAVPVDGALVTGDAAVACLRHGVTDLLPLR